MKTEIEWDGEKSVEYSRDETRVLMAANPYTSWERQKSDGRYVMSRDGLVHFYDGRGSHAQGTSLWDDFHRCVGCRECYPCYPSEEAECPQCGRALDSYPHYWQHGYATPSGEMFCAEYEHRAPKAFMADGEIITLSSSDNDFENHPNYTRITTEEAERLREEELIDGANRERCSRCGGEGQYKVRYSPWSANLSRATCPRCHGSGVEPQEEDGEETENKLNLQRETTYQTSIYISGPLKVIKQTCRKYCQDIGLCVTVTPTNFIYSGGEESGAHIGLIQYPRYPDEPLNIDRKTEELANNLLEDTHQDSVLIINPHNTTLFSRRD